MALAAGVRVKKLLTKPAASVLRLTLATLSTMYQSSVAFEAPLTPRMFFAADGLALENKCVFETTWQMVGLASSIAKSGQYISTNIGLFGRLTRTVSMTIC